MEPDPLRQNSDIENSQLSTARRAVALPSLLIGGAPKCATSTLFSLLSQHPQIAASTPKETFFFVDRDYPLQPSGATPFRDGLESYGRFFEEGAVEAGKKLMDGTTHYLYQESARRVLASDAQDCIACFMVRDPAQRMHSSFIFAQQNKTHIKRKLRFPNYVDCLLDDNMESIRQHFVSDAIYQIFCRELSNSRYIEHLQRWSESIGRSRLLVCKFEDFVRRPESAVAPVCEKLGVDAFADFRQYLRKEKPTVVNRSWYVHRLATATARALENHKAIRSRLKWIYRGLQGDRRRSVDTESMNAIGRLREYFREDNERLAESFGIDYLHSNGC
ncbi:Sulfotransferase domain protein [Stieleria neptunia]|uniref:Sulfotransferase domain protein n=1 Tax=Stieleria neptunia TaxID=2527979 RepID=A0A518HN76_9BACT|nr:sulfotransferase [Stieleria neptunia]QDV42301.1 Sulfotransferase domain protein [Stieleria neptunia]